MFPFSSFECYITRFLAILGFPVLTICLLYYLFFLDFLPLSFFRHVMFGTAVEPYLKPESQYITPKPLPLASADPQLATDGVLAFTTINHPKQLCYKGDIVLCSHCCFGKSFRDDLPRTLSRTLNFRNNVQIAGTLGGVDEMLICLPGTFPQRVRVEADIAQKVKRQFCILYTATPHTKPVGKTAAPV